MVRDSRNKRGFVASPFKGTIILLTGLFLCYWNSTSLVESCQAAPNKLTISNAAISVTLHIDDATLSVTDKRTGHTWRQKSLTEAKIIQAARTKYGIEMTWRQPGLDMDFETELLLDKNLPEFTLALTSKGELKWSLRFPHPFITEPGTYLVVPMNEGISYPVEDETISPRRLVAYGGHGICMPFWGVTDG